MRLAWVLCTLAGHTAPGSHGSIHPRQCKGYEDIKVQSENLKILTSTLQRLDLMFWPSILKKQWMLFSLVILDGFLSSWLPVKFLVPYLILLGCLLERLLARFLAAAAG